MRKTLLLFLFCISFAQAQQLDFFQFITIPGFQAYDVKQTPDGGYLVAGGVQSINGGDFVLVQLDSIGNQMWTFTNNRFDGFNGSNKIYSLSIVDGYYYLAGEIYDFSQPSSSYPIHIYIVKMDSLHNKIWEKQDSVIGGQGVAYKINKASDNNLLVTGTILQNDSVKLYSAKIDSSGHVIWKHNFYFSTDQAGLDIIESNSDFLVGGFYHSISDSPFTSIDTTASILFNFDSSGAINWYNEYPDTCNNGFSSILLSDGGGIYCGQYYAPMYTNPSNPNSAILKFDSQGNLIFRKEFQNSDARFVGVARHDNAGFIVAYDFAEVLFLDSNCDSISSFRLNPGYPLASMLLDNEKRTVLVGHYQPSASWPYTSYVFRVSDTTITGIGQLLEPSALTVYPNPASNYIIIYIEDMANTIENIEIISVMGKTLFTTNSGFPVAVLDLAFLENGSYILKIKLHNTLHPVIKHFVKFKQ